MLHVSEGQDPRRLPGGGAAPVPPAPVQVQWPQTVAVIFNPSSGGDTASERGDRIRQAIQDTGRKLIWLETTPTDSGQGWPKTPWDRARIWSSRPVATAR
jgi:hypothetical protein